MKPAVRTPFFETSVKNYIYGDEVLRFAQAVDAATPMVALGLDSLQALEFYRRVKAEFDHELDVAELLRGASLDDVLARLGG